MNTVDESLVELPESLRVQMLVPKKKKMDKGKAIVLSEPRNKKKTKEELAVEASDCPITCFKIKEPLVPSKSVMLSSIMPTILVSIEMQ